jgi:hypothetical protein
MILVFAAETSMLATPWWARSIVPGNATRVYVPGPYDRPIAGPYYRGAGAL